EPPRTRRPAPREEWMTESTGTVRAPGTRDAPLEIGGRTFRSRLIVGTGKYRTNQEMVDAIRASGADMVTVAVRRVDLDRTKSEGILHHLDPDEFFLLANTAGCYTAEDAVRYARLARSEERRGGKERSSGSSMATSIANTAVGV